jgi:hypothetical protein
MLHWLPTRRLLQHHLLGSKNFWRSTFPYMLSVTMEHAHTQAAPQPSNKHLSVDAEGNTQVDLEFIEEPLGPSAEQGHGFLRIEFGDAIGPDNRYKAVRKLAWGMNSSVRMAFDGKCIQLTSDINVVLTSSIEKRDTS